MTIQVGDIVAIRGDIRRRMDGSCMYDPSQLVDGKYLKHTGTGNIWTGRVEAIKGDKARVGGGWRGLEYYVPILSVDHNISNGGK
ncbi:hypothetical protein [Pseudomonas phage pPA-3099-2aT.2]|uniref:Uncharacterized protein n=1 Tax=Pseudomonas phage pPA-3099-2aT.2 TaxID=3003808 RepID=A0AAF0ATG8_9CAUD|nr:hypothetical protein QE325_gp135 [Pseudomonas phage pPA-3099-2aT.2]WBQ35246.1 hypothetical protein [Pseudomonas phage pPA-3099-2aT.2]